MILAGVILAPTIRADAISDLGDLRTVIDDAAQAIGVRTNASRTWGLNTSSSSQMGTADLVQNITVSILHANADLGSNQTKWINVTSTTNGTLNNVNLTETGLDNFYIDYVSAIPNLSVALSTLGRSWHSELNQPVSNAVDALQQTITTFSSSLLQAGLIHSNSTLRTIRSTNSLEDAQTAWSRILNLPGPSRAASPASRRRLRHRDATKLDAPPPTSLEGIASTEALHKNHHTPQRSFKPATISGKHYTHEELWGRGNQPGQRHLNEGGPRISDGIVPQEKRRAAIPFRG